MKKNEYTIRSPLWGGIRYLRFGMLMTFIFLSWGAYAQTPIPAIPFDGQNNVTEPVQLEWANTTEGTLIEVYEFPLQNSTLRLGSYTLICGGEVDIPVETATNSSGEIKYNLSGVTYNSETKTLFMVTDKPTKVYETELDGTILRVIDLTGGFDDTEAIVHIGGTRFAVTEEEKARIVFFDIDANTTNVAYTDQHVTITAAVNDSNDGLEGLAYNPLNNTIHAVKEKENNNDTAPRAYYTFPMPETLPTSLSQGTQCREWNTAPDGDDDYAGLHHLGATSGLHHLNLRNNFLVLGEGGSRLLQINDQCQEVSRRNFGVNRLEGVTMDDNGRLYIVSENDDETSDNISKLYIFDYIPSLGARIIQDGVFYFDNTYTIPSGTLESGKRYGWRVKDLFNNSCELWSEFSHFTIGGGCPDNLVITDADVPSQYIEASNSIVTQGTVTVDNQEELILDAGAYVELFPGFDANKSIPFEARIGGCTPTNPKVEQETYDWVKHYPNPFRTEVTLEFNLNNDSETSIRITDVTGRTIHQNPIQQLNSGNQNITLSTQDWIPGTYFYQVFIKENNTGITKRANGVLVKM